MSVLQQKPQKNWTNSKNRRVEALRFFLIYSAAAAVVASAAAACAAAAEQDNDYNENNNPIASAKTVTEHKNTSKNTLSVPEPSFRAHYII